MTLLSAKLRQEGDSIIIWCPGCETTHSLRVRGALAWTWNGDAERPTCSPSLLVQSGHYAPWRKPSAECWCGYEKRYGEPSPFKCNRCHSFIENGQIRFLADCSHALAGQTVPIPDLPEGFRE